MPGTFALSTIGCRLNQYELEAIGARLEALGFQQVPDDDSADVTVINTCTVTARADADGRAAVRRARRRSPQGKVIVTGCYATAQPDLLRALGDADLIVDNREKDRLLEHMVEAFGYAIPGGIDWAVINSPRFAVDRFRMHTRAMVKIQDGCQEACTYCIIPRARGHERSRSPEAVTAEICALEANGYREVVLTGVHAGKYRYGNLRLAGLLARILSASRLPHIRLSSLEPRELRPDLVRLLATEPRLCPHLHIAIQSGDDRVLSAMRRSYDTAYVRDLFTTLSERRPEMAIGTDLITGFPGETEEEFGRTVAFVRSLPLAYLHVFSYSDRPGTAAALMPGKVPSEVTRRRTRVLRRLGRQLRTRFIERHLGTTVDVLIERRRDATTGRLLGTSGNFLRVQVEGPDVWINRIVPVRITGRLDECAIGEPAEVQAHE